MIKKKHTLTTGMFIKVEALIKHQRNMNKICPEIEKHQTPFLPNSRHYVIIFLTKTKFVYSKMNLKERNRKEKGKKQESK